MTIAAFDFDGTITTRDTLWEFLKFSQRKFRLLSGGVALCPVMLLYLLKIISNGRAKEILFGRFFKGWKLTDFDEVCARFAPQIDKILRPETIALLRERRNAGDEIYIVSASVENWIMPWAKRNGAHVLATQVEVSASGLLTGKFKTPNCYGGEKVRRLAAAVPHRKACYLRAYGDSKGDWAMLAYADEGFRV